MNEETQILKIDERGRILTSPEQRNAALDAFEHSGMTGAQFARHAGIKYPTLMNWIQRRRRERAATALPKAAAPGSGWIEAVVESRSAGNLTIEIAGDLRVTMSDESSVTVVVKLLRELGYGRSC
jgi:hypothetical protein